MVVYEPFPTTPLSEFHAELRFEWKDLPAELFDYYLLRTAIEMCRKAPLVTRTVRIKLQPGVTRYAVKSPDGMEMTALTGVSQHPTGSDSCLHDVRRTLVAGEDWPRLRRDKVWYDPDEQVLHACMCDCGGELRVSMGVVPGRNSCALPSQFEHELFPALIMGTRASIMLITGRPWTNLKVGSELYAEFRRMMGKLAQDAALCGQRGIVKIGFGRAL